MGDYDEYDPDFRSGAKASAKREWQESEEDGMWSYRWTPWSPAVSINGFAGTRVELQHRFPGLSVSYSSGALRLSHLDRRVVEKAIRYLHGEGASLPCGLAARGRKGSLFTLRCAETGKVLGFQTGKDANEAHQVWAASEGRPKALVFPVSYSDEDMMYVLCELLETQGLSLAVGEEK